jgi:hypothetical protein
MNSALLKFNVLGKKMILCKNKLEVIFNKASNHKLEDKNNSLRYLIILSLERNQLNQTNHGLNLTEI